MTRMVLPVAVATLASAGLALLYLHRTAAPACGSEPAMGKVYEVLRSEFHLDSILVNDVRTISGGFFSNGHNCAAEVTEIRGNINASNMPWREIRYRIVQQETPQRTVITVELGSYVALSPPAPSLWNRLLAYF